VVKRLVFEATQGQHKGMHCIIGHTGQIGNQLPEHLMPFEFLGRVVEFAGLIKVTPKYALYRETFPKPKGKFGQTMETFHPDQS
jgi:hypothetical protein